MWIKICGLTTPAEAVAVAKLNPAAVGLNFYAGSSRGISVETACEISHSLPAGPLKVGVFVDHTPAEITRIAETVPLDVVQLHGHYTVEQALELRQFPLIWVYRLGEQGLAPLLQELKEFAAANFPLYACLIDARVAGHYGGSGQTVDWTYLSAQYPVSTAPPLILAGGLSPENIQEAIHTVHPWGVDVASGVETVGRKDLKKCQLLIERAANSSC